MDYFKLAVDLMKLEAAPTLARVAQKHTHLRTIKAASHKVCGCSAYGFPHRSGGGNCPAPEPTSYTNDREELRLFDANEARSINAGDAG